MDADERQLRAACLYEQLAILYAGYQKAMQSSPDKIMDWKRDIRNIEREIEQLRDR